MKIATAAYPIDFHSRWNDYVGKLRVWIRSAAEQGADLLVFPEYGGLELASLAGEENVRDLQRSTDAVTARIKDVDDLHGSLAREFKVHICAASAPMRRDGGTTVNRARLFAPDGSFGTQDKLVLSRFEREDWGLKGGAGARVFDTALGKIGILLGYDVEFPAVARAMAEAGAEILLAASANTSLAGYWRVRIGAMARAFESQCVVAHAVTIGTAEWLVAAEKGVGAAAVFGPADTGFPDDGVIVLGKMDTAGWTYAEIDRAAIAKVRAEGVARTLTDWPGPVAGAETLTLGAVA